MAAPDLGFRLRDRLGPEAVDDLRDVFEEIETDVLAITTDRFEARLDARLTVLATQLRSEIALTQAELRHEIACGDTAFRVAFLEGMSRIRGEIAQARVDTLRWSFVFGLGHVIATASLLAFMLRAR